MNGLLWIAQILLAGVFLFAGGSKILAYDELVKAVEAKSKGGKIGMSRSQAAVVGIAELIGAVGVVVPVDPWPPLHTSAGGGGGVGAADGSRRHLSHSASGIGRAFGGAVSSGAFRDCRPLAPVGPGTKRIGTWD